MEGCLVWMPMTPASRGAARASRLPPGSPCCAPGGHHLVLTIHSGHNQAGKRHSGGGEERHEHNVGEERGVRIHTGIQNCFFLPEAAQF